MKTKWLIANFLRSAVLWKSLRGERMGKTSVAQSIPSSINGTNLFADIDYENKVVDYQLFAQCSSFGTKK